ncbi:MAG: hypothetical protein ACREBI_01970 [Nitrosotalea sp.]
MITAVLRLGDKAVIREIKHRSVRRSYSLPEDITASFDTEASNLDGSPSTLLSRLMRKWLAFDLPLQTIGTVTMAEPCFQSIINKTSPDVLHDIALEQSTKNFSTILSLFGGRTEFNDIIESYYKRFGKYSGWYSFKHEIDGDHKIILHHNKGIKWSRFLADYNLTVLEKISEKVDYNIDNNLVMFNVIPKKKAILNY